MSSEADEDIDSVFSMESRNLPGLDDRNGDVKRTDVYGSGDWRVSDAGASGDVFEEVHEFGGGDGEGAAEDYTPWSFSAEGKEEPDDDLFGGVEDDGEEIGFSSLGDGGVGVDKSEEQKQLEAEEKALTAVLEGGMFN